MLGLGDIGPRAAMPVMEGKAMLFKEFAGVDAFPVCLDTTDVDEIVAVVKAIAPSFGGINLEDISAPRCFEIESRLQAELDIPVFHDDQHGTAVVVLAALLNALTLTGHRIGDIRVVVVGLGAAGIAVSDILLAAGVRHLIGCDSRGAVHTEREDYLDGSMSPVKHDLAQRTNLELRSGGPVDVIEGADLLHRTQRRARAARRGAGQDEPGPDRVRHGQPRPGGVAGGGATPRPHPRHRAL